MQLHLVNRQILEADRGVLAWYRTSEASRRLDRIPGIGPLIATALVACGFTFRNTAVVDAGNAAWLVREHRSDDTPFVRVEFISHDSCSDCWGAGNHTFGVGVKANVTGLIYFAN
jgi:hypothetical protein